MWYEWNTLEEFNTWHDNLCTIIGYPITAVNQATGLPDENAQKVVRYTEVIEVDNKWIAWVDDQYKLDLVPTQLRRKKPLA